MKACTNCEVIKSPAEFPPAKKNKDGTSSWCRECVTECGKSWYRNLSSDERKRKNKAKHLKYTFGISLEEYEALFDDQNGVCAICSNPPSGLALAVDHCHATGKLRGLLCVKCNTAIGKLNDDVVLLARAIQYLEERK